MGWAFWTGVRLPSSPPEIKTVIMDYSLFIFNKLTFIDLLNIIEIYELQ